MAAVKSMSVRYRHYKNWKSVPDSYIPHLNKLNLGWAGFMIDLVNERVGDHIVIATNRNIPIAWAIRDNNNKINLYVKRCYRNLDIASKLTDVWCKRLKRFIQVMYNQWDRRIYGDDEYWSNIVYTEEAGRIVDASIKRLGILKPKRKKRRKKRIRVRHIME